MLDRYFDQINVGDTWISRGRTITETDLVLFSAFTGDWYPLHTDVEYAAKTPFGQRIAHGMLVLSVGTGLLVIEPHVLVAFYGIDKLRFTGPTFIGDTIHVELEVINKESSNDKHGLVTLKLDLVGNKGDTKLTATCRVLLNKQVL